MAQNNAPDQASEAKRGRAGGFQKTLAQRIRDEIQAANAEGKTLRVMFMDEARFGRISELRQCWAPAGTRPVVPKQVVREWTYAYAAVAPHDGALVFMVRPKANTIHMTEFIAMVSQRFPSNRIVMVMDGAGWHRAKALALPPNIHRIFLPPYSPELNPTEHIWEYMRETDFANRVYATLDAVEASMNTSLIRLGDNPKIIRSMCGFEWIVIVSLK